MEAKNGHQVRVKNLEKVPKTKREVRWVLQKKVFVV